MSVMIQVESPDWGPQICKGLKELYDEKIGCNVAIYGSDGGTLESHACVLMAVSPTLKTWLAGDPIQGCHSVEIDTITCETWRLLLEFIYSGGVQVEKNNVHEMLDASEKLQISHLTVACKMAMKTPRKGNPRQVITAANGGYDLSTKPSQDVVKMEEEPIPADLSKDKVTSDRSSPVETTSEQPLDLTKLTTKLETPVKEIKKEITSEKLPPALPTFPPATDPQMQAVMAMYYNQMLQYSMMAQNMKPGGNPMLGNLPTSAALPGGATAPVVPPHPVSSMMSMMPQPFVPNESNSQDGRQRKFPCSICGMLFFTRHVKEQHELTHTNLKPYSCNICGFRARQKAVIWRHKKNRHPEADSSVSMDVLTTSTPSSPECEEDEDNQSSISTNSTGQIVPSPDSNKPASLGSYSAINTVPTPAIHMPLSSVPPLVPTDPTKPYVCQTCGRGFKNKYILSQHAMIHSNVRRYACDICGFRAKQMSVIYNHKRNKHWVKKDEFPNGAIHFEENNPLNLLANSAIACSKAKKRPRETSGNLKQVEYEMQHAKQTADGYLCRLCGTTTATRILLQDHIMTHFKIRRYPCGYCNYRAKQRSGLLTHMKMKHKGIRMVNSFLMKKKAKNPKRFTGAPNTFQPMRKKYTCHTCNKSFKMKHVLVQHQLVHLNTRRYCCKYCGFRAKQKALVYRHNQDVHPGHKSKVMDLLRPRADVPEKITPILPKKNTDKMMNDHFKDMSKPQKNFNTLSNEMNNKPKIEPVVIKPQADMRKPEDLSYLTNKLKSQIMTQQKQFENMGNFTPKLVGSNLIYAMSLPHQQPPSMTPIKGPAPPFVPSDKNGDPPAIYSSYGTPDKPHRCKVCGRCFRLRHVMEQHELTHSNFRKYMCDICGFRAKQKAVIYRHKKVKHPNHPGAGRVALVPEASDSMDNGSKPQTSPGDIPPQLIPVNKQMSPSDNPEIAHNNNKNISPFNRLTPNSINGGSNKMMENPYDKVSPQSLRFGSPLQGMGWYMAPDKEDSEDEEVSEYSRGESLSTNMAMGLPSMVPSSKAINLSLPPMAPLSPDQGSPTDELDKKYTCQVCGRSFKHRHVLEQHYITHTGLRPYKCEFCDFCARQKASLWRHRQKHLVGGPLAMQ